MRYEGRRRGNGTAGVALSRGWVMTMTEIMERVTGGLRVISGTWYPVRSFLDEGLGRPFVGSEMLSPDLMALHAALNCYTVSGMQF